MKKVNSNILKKTAALFMVAVLVTPGLVFAVEERKELRVEKRNELRTNRPGGDFCSQIGTFTGSVEGRMQARDAKINGKREKRRENIGERRTNRTQRVSQRRAERNEKRDNRFAELEEKSQNNEQKEVIREYISDVRAAIEKRRNSIDTAVDAYRAQLDELLDQKEDATSRAVASFRNAVTDAGAQAKASCETGEDAPVVRQNYIAALKAAREELRIAHGEMKAYRLQAQELTEERKTAIESAVKEFRATMEARKAALKEALSA